MDTLTLPIIHVSTSHWTRNRLPQIKNERVWEGYLRAHGIRFQHAWRAASRLRPVQNEIDLQKVVKLISAGLDTKRFPIVVSRDHYIIDGHHRAWAARILGARAYAQVVDRAHRSVVELAEKMGAEHNGITHDDAIVKGPRA